MEDDVVRTMEMVRPLVVALAVMGGLSGPAPARADVLTVPPVADTYVSAGGQATWDHGRATQLKVRATSRVTYVAFDLPGLAGPVLRVTLVLSPTRPARDGGTVYRVADNRWVEGSGTGALPSSDGLRFVDVDRNSDGLLDARDGSALAPDPALAVGAMGVPRRGRAQRVDVTAAFQDGPGRYTLALAGAAGAAFASREYPTVARRPLLEIVITTDPSVPTTTTTTTITAAPGSTTSTTLPVPPRPAAPGACLAQPGPLLTVAGTYGSRYSRGSLVDNTRVDARAGVFLASPANLYPLILGGGAGVCVAGGTVLGQYDRTLSWQAMHDLNHAGIVLDGPLAVEGIRIDDVEDGIRPRSGFFTVRQVWLSYIRDDCVENDHLQSGLIEDSLFDGCYVGLSERPSPSSTTDGRGGLVTVRSSLLRLQPMPGPRGGMPTDLGHGVFFKWDARATALALYDNVFMAEGPNAGGVPDALADCARNVMVWLGPGDYPVRLPGCFTVTRDRSVWDAAVAAWKASHPGVAGQ